MHAYTHAHITCNDALQERIQGPLSVLCATWNVGNAAPPPPAALQEWLWGAGQ